MSLTERFWKKVRKEPNGCWPFIGGLNTSGYGNFSLNKRYSTNASRVAYLLCRGPIPLGMVVCHQCDNPACVRPDHLFLGTPADNTRDAAQKGRMAHGEKHPAHKIRGADVIQIRQKYNSGIPTRIIAREYGLAQNHVARILRGTAWSRIGGPLQSRLGRWEFRRRFGYTSLWRTF